MRLGADEAVTGIVGPGDRRCAGCRYREHHIRNAGYRAEAEFGCRRRNERSDPAGSARIGHGNQIRHGCGLRALHEFQVKGIFGARAGVNGIAVTGIEIDRIVLAPNDLYVSGRSHVDIVDNRRRTRPLAVFTK